MQPDPTPDLDELTKLEKAATPSPWKRDRNWHVTGPDNDWDEHWGSERVGHDLRKCNPSLDQRICHVFGPAGNGNSPDADFALIAAARNALPWLLRAARERDELLAERDAARIALGGHATGDFASDDGCGCTMLGLVRLCETHHDWLKQGQAEMKELRARAEKAEARAKELEAELYGPALETLRDLLSTYGPDYVLVKAHRIERAREVCARIQAAWKLAEGR